MAASLNITSLSDGLLAAEPNGAPAILSISDEATPIEFANHEPVSAAQPKRSVKQTSAQWLDDPVANTAASSNWKLRWRKPATVVNASASDMDTEPLAVSRAVAWGRTTGLNSADRFPVRTVAQQTPVDPFEELAPQPSPQNRAAPGGRTIPSPTAPEQTIPSPTTPERADPALNDPFLDPPIRPVPQDPMPSESPAPMPSEMPFPPERVPAPDADLAPVPPRDMGTPDSLLGPSVDEMPCDRKYNDRNCCADDAKCLKAQQYVAQAKITSIHLDITPTFTNTQGPAGEGYIPTEIKQQQELAKAPSRIWKNRAGRMVAEGRFGNYRNGTVHVVGANGETVKIPYNTLSDDDICFVTAWWSIPSECTLADSQFQQRNWLASTVTWKASALCHKPLYFEEVALERYGHSVGPIKQPFVSGAHFFGSVITLPYQMAISPPNECEYALGYYRPGSCAPWLVPAVPISLRGALAEAGAWVGGIYIIP